MAVPRFEEFNETDVQEEIIAPLLRALGYWSGTDNNIVVANVAKINATGNDINIVWGSGIGGKAPKISQKKGNDINIVHAGK